MGYLTQPLVGCVESVEQFMWINTQAGSVSTWTTIRVWPLLHHRSEWMSKGSENRDFTFAGLRNPRVPGDKQIWLQDRECRGGQGECDLPTRLSWIGGRGSRRRSAIKESRDHSEVMLCTSPTQVRMHTIVQQYNPEARGDRVSSPSKGGMLLLEGGGGGGVGGSPGARARNRRDMSLDAVVARARSRCGRGKVGL